jgi:Uma2 family endonuclease
LTAIKSPDLKTLLRSPKLSLYAREIQSYLNEETRRREAYYDWLTPDVKAEFINGEIIVQSPAKKRHTDVVANLATLLRTYVDEHDLGFLGAETVLISLTRNDYLPDIVFFTAGHARELSPDQMKSPPPDFVVEVLSPSTEEKDRQLKFEDYAAHGVMEYWLVDPEQQTVEQYLLGDEAPLEVSSMFLASRFARSPQSFFSISVQVSSQTVLNS